MKSAMIAMFVLLFYCFASVSLCNAREEGVCWRLLLSHKHTVRHHSG